MKHLMIVVESTDKLSGQGYNLLCDALRVHGISINDCCVVPLANKVTHPKSKFFFNKGAPTDALFSGIIRLVEKIKEVQPRTILSLGETSLWALTQEASIFNRRGAPIQSTLPGSPVVLPTIDPSWYFNSRQFQKTPIFDWDVAKAVRYAKEGWKNPAHDATFLTSPSEQEIIAAWERFKNADLLSVDSEWYQPEALAYVGFADAKDFAIIIEPRDDFRRTMLKKFLTLDIPKVMQNAMFDVVALDRIDYQVTNVKHDTMVAWHWCWPRMGEKGLNFISSITTDWSYYKGDIEFVGEDERGKAYCATDCVVTFEAMDKIITEEFPVTLGNTGYDISMLMMEPFLEASKLGILADTDKLDKLETKYTAEADRLEATLADIIGHTFNCRSSQQVCEVVYDEIGIPGRSKRTSAQDVLMDIAASEEREDVKEVLTAIIRVRQNRNIVSNHINRGIVDYDGRIRTNWNLANTPSGRLSTTNPWWNGVAIQTVPIDGREIYIPDPGHVFVGWDLAQAEARYVAAETRDFELLQAMDEGRDAHALLAPMLDMTYEEIMDLVAKATAAGKSKDTVEERFLLKTCRHSMNYVQSWAGLKKRVNKQYLETGIGITAAKAKELADGYLELNPGLEAWWHEIYLKVKRDGWLENAFGRRVSFPGEAGRIRSRDHVHRSAVSYRPQSSISDLTTLSINRVWERARWMQILIHAHDGGLYQVPEGREEEAEQIIMEEMTKPIRAGKMMITIPVETKTGMNWKEMG
jgi:DNA polymerase I